MENPAVSHPAAHAPHVLGCASQGAGGDDEARLRTLLSSFQTEWIAFDRARKKQSFFACLRRLRSGGFDLFVLEGTGIAAGLAALLGRRLYGRRYVLSSGDAVAPFLSAKIPLAAPVFRAYERALYRNASGFIGWTPYLVGRALTMGARRAITSPGWAPCAVDAQRLVEQRGEVRQRLGIPDRAVVFGIAGALVWSSRYRFCYGADLVRAVRAAHSNACVLIVGDGSGLSHLRDLAGSDLNKTIFLPGRVRRDEVPAYLAAMDIGSLPQTVDGVGSFRYTTKLAEYRSVGLPFVTNQIPMAYDLDGGDIWRLPGDTPWSPAFERALIHLMETADAASIAARRTRSLASARCSGTFDREVQVQRVTAFLEDILGTKENESR